MGELDRIAKSEAVLAQAAEEFTQIKQIKTKLEQKRKDGKLIYDNWRGSVDWKQWRLQQLEQQNWKCACCSKRMGFGETTYLANGNFELEPHHPTVDHVLPKSLFPELALDPRNLVMLCWMCNKKKSNKMAPASRMRHKMLEQKMNYESKPDQSCK